MLFSLATYTLLSLSFCLAIEPCTRPSIRKEWRSLSYVEREEWVTAVKCLANLPHDDALAPTVNPTDIVPVNKSSSYYDDLVYMHMDLNHRIHSTGLFLPWHRWYVYSYEEALKSKCGFSGTSPYWNWAIDAADVHGSSMFQDSDPKAGLGGWGDPTNDVSVPGGGFGVNSSFKLSYPSYHSLRRNFTIQPWLGTPPPVNAFIANESLYANATFTEQEVHKLVHSFVGDYKAFQTYFEAFQGAHGAVHLSTGGDLAGACPKNAPSDCVSGAPTFSANEPLFWMHHAMVDRIWYLWQRQDKRNALAFYGGSVQALDNVTHFDEYPTGAPPFLTPNDTLPGDGLFPDAKISDVLSTTSGILCYIYD
ncbi:Di-copper centre-containing protein [Mycena floridula]|nr:Di-copper centre-containing protein [Mycena floridula]